MTSWLNETATPVRFFACAADSQREEFLLDLDKPAHVTVYAVISND